MWRESDPFDIHLTIVLCWFCGFCRQFLQWEFFRNWHSCFNTQIHTRAQAASNACWSCFLFMRTPLWVGCKIHDQPIPSSTSSSSSSSSAVHYTVRQSNRFLWLSGHTSSTVFLIGVSVCAEHPSTSNRNTVPHTHVVQFLFSRSTFSYHNLQIFSHQLVSSFESHLITCACVPTLAASSQNAAAYWLSAPSPSSSISSNTFPTLLIPRLCTKWEKLNEKFWSNCFSSPFKFRKTFQFDSTRFNLVGQLFTGMSSFIVTAMKICQVT